MSTMLNIQSMNTGESETVLLGKTCMQSKAKQDSLNREVSLDDGVAGHFSVCQMMYYTSYCVCVCGIEISDTVKPMWWGGGTFNKGCVCV